MKETYPVETSEYTRAYHIDDEQDFYWLGLYTLRKRDDILLAVKERTMHVDIKYVIKVPCTTKESREINLASGNIMW